MWQATYEKSFSGVTREEVWAAWQDVNRWHGWDEEIEFAQIDGPFAAGQEFVLKPKGGPKVSIRIVECEPLQGFTDVTRFPLAKMVDAHKVERTPEGVKLTSTIRVEGPLSWLWRKIVAEGVAAGVPAQMEALVRFLASDPKPVAQS